MRGLPIYAIGKNSARPIAGATAIHLPGFNHPSYGTPERSSDEKEDGYFGGGGVCVVVVGVRGYADHERRNPPCGNFRPSDLKNRDLQGRNADPLLPGEHGGIA